MKQIFWTGIAFLTALSVYAAEIRIKPENAVIHSSGGRENQAAAQELKTHLELITGQKIPIAAAGQPLTEKFVFFIGTAPEDSPKSFKPEEARWEITPTAAYFYGDKLNGTRNAVYDFLENELGVRWPSGEDIAFTHQNPLIVRNPKGVWAPELNLRGIRGSKPGLRLWKQRMRYGGHNQPIYGHAFTNWWKNYGKTHPEYFAMNNGVRGPVGFKPDANNVAAFQGKAGEAVALCVSNPAVVRRVLENWNGKTEYVNICENDAHDIHSCHCETCKALDTLKPGESWVHNLADRYIHFANEVSKEALKIRKDAKVSIYAYNASEQAPRREKPMSNIVIGIVPTDFHMDSIKSYVESWKKVGMNRFFYRPNRHHYYETQLPCGYEKHFFDLWQYLYKSGALGFDYDSKGANTPSQYFSDYVISKAMQDPSKDFEYWENHYMQSFGPAADEIRDYYRYWRNVWNTRLYPNLAKITTAGKVYNFARGLLWNINEYYKPADFDATDKILENARKKKNLSPEERARIENLLVFNQHARLIVNAAGKKTDQDSIALVKFREKHKFPLLPWDEQYFGDICGIKRVMDFKDFTPPYLKTPLFWNFKLDPKNVGLKEEWFKDASKLHQWGEMMPTNGPWETPHKHYKFPSAKMRELTANYDGIAWYGCAISIPSDWKNRTVLLYFGAVDESAWIYVNGKEAGRRINQKPNDWTTPFTIDITSCIDWNRKDQFVIVRVEDNAGLGGIWKPVWIVSKQK